MPEKRQQIIEIILKHDRLLNFENQYFRKDASTFTGNLHMQVVRNTDGSVSHLEGFVEDITERKKAEEALRESEERYRAIFKNAAAGINLSDREGRFMGVNSTAANMYGYTQEELQGLTLFDITHPDDVDASRQQLLALQQGKKDSYRLENRYIRKDGKVIWAELSVSAIRDAKGEYAATLAVAVDITERKRAEARLRTSEANLSNALEMAHLGHWEYDVTKDLFTFNDQFYKIFRTTAKQVGGYTMAAAEYARRFLHPDDMHVVRDEIRKSMESTYPDLSQQLEHRILYADGEVGHINVRIFVVRDSLGRPVKTYGVNQDITERVRMQEALKESEEWYRTLVEESFDGIFVYTGPKITFANRRLHEMLGYAQGELEGKDHLQLSHPDHRKVVRERSSARLGGEEVPSKYGISLLRKDGSSLEVEINAKAISIKGEPGIQVWVRDISKEISLQRQLLQAQKMEAIGTLAGGIAHDFNNMLTIILGYAEILLSDMDEQDPRSEDLDKIVQTAKNGADLVKRLLTFSRKADLEFRPLELNVEIERTQKLWERTLPKMIDIRLNLEDKLAPINADPVQIDQILMNLAINARDAMPDGGKLAIETKNVTLDERYCDSHVHVRPGKYVMLSISDTGHGMDEPTRARIFDPFFTTKERDATKGTGLGLAVVHGIVDQHGGHMICESEPGKGSTFRIYFPAVDAAESPKDSFANRLLDGRGETILMVDDEELVRDLGERTLKRAGYKVITAANGKEALELYSKKQGKIELVILDLLMPEMGGKQCLSELLRIRPKIKVLVASGHSDDVSMEESLRLGAKGFVSKPFRLMELLQQVRRVLDEK